MRFLFSPDTVQDKKEVWDFESYADLIIHLESAYQFISILFVRERQDAK